jgi:hypothetical protein
MDKDPAAGWNTRIITGFPKGTNVMLIQVQERGQQQPKARITTHTVQLYADGTKVWYRFTADEVSSTFKGAAMVVYGRA